MRVGVEVGGTFTDLVVVRDGAIEIAKVPSTPAQPDVGALNVIQAADITIAAIDDLVHGSTVATNAVLERSGGRIGVFVTAGTRDLFHLQRQDRTSIYDLNYRKPEPVVARCDICEIPERLAPDGTVIQAVDHELLNHRVQQFLDTGAFDAIAICLLHSYANPAHEQLVASAIRRFTPAMPISCSTEVSPEFREYERASNGGRMPVEGMAQNSIAGLFSGPAAGVVGAVGTATRSGFKDIITVDMGGTSTDVALIANARPALRPQTAIDGLPVRTPVMDIATVGAGGGSIAWLDDGGLLLGRASICRGAAGTGLLWSWRQTTHHYRRPFGPRHTAIAIFPRRFYVC